MGRAQVVQAECARIRPVAEMNPILLKPTSAMGSAANWIISCCPAGRSGTGVWMMPVPRSQEVKRSAQTAQTIKYLGFITGWLLLMSGWLIAISSKFNKSHPKTQIIFLSNRTLPPGLVSARVSSVAGPGQLRPRSGQVPSQVREGCVPGQGKYRPWSALLSGTGDAFRPLRTYNVAGPQGKHGPGTQNPRTGDGKQQTGDGKLQKNDPGGKPRSLKWECNRITRPQR